VWKETARAPLGRVLTSTPASHGSLTNPTRVPEKEGCSLSLRLGSLMQQSWWLGDPRKQPHASGWEKGQPEPTVVMAGQEVK
jgi:hypothetical protein